MLVEIQSNDNGSGMNTLLCVHRSTNDKIKLFEQRPIVSIEEDDFFELFPNPEKEFEKAQNGKIHFRIAFSKLIEKSKTIYHH
jgi:hypothetical protein